MKPIGRFGVAAGIAFAVLGATGARAVPVPAPCTKTTLNVYDAPGFSCTITDKLFSDFSYTNTVLGGALPVPDTAVTVMPLPVAGDPGLSFIAAWNASTTQANDAAFGFAVEALGPAIDDASLTVTGSVAGSGTVTVGETLSNGVALSVGIPTPGVTDSVSFSPVKNLDITKDLAVFGGNTTLSTGSASIVTNRFSEVPEPAGLAVIGLGLLGLGVARRRPAKG